MAKFPMEEKNYERRIAIDRKQTSYGVAVDADAAEATRPPVQSSGGRAAVRFSARLSADVSGPPPTRNTGALNTSINSSTSAERRARAAQRALEVEDNPRVLRDKCRRLARALRNAKHLVVYTGAGISTAADIPDYRGPHGVWTRLQRGETVGRVEVSRARPTFTHMALTALWARGALKFVASQNCDGLHLRAGLPRRALAELHGNMFAELCTPCRRLYLRAFDTTERTARHRHGTRRLCHACGAELRDSIVHFGERGRAAWPLNWAGALRHAARADVVLCLGSSLKVLRRYPRLWRMRSAPAARPALYIVNLQWTPKDAVAALKINARCDAVMRQVARRLRLRVPPYRAAFDPLLAHAEPLAPPEAHTSRRPLLRAPAPPPPPPPLRPPTPLLASSSPSASDSDEEVPLVRLADRLRGPRPGPGSAPLPGPGSAAAPEMPLAPRLRAFRVSLHSGEATILLRAEHAPSPPASPVPPPASPVPPPAGTAVAGPYSPTAELRRFRIRRKPASELESRTNGYGDSLGSRLRRLLEGGASPAPATTPRPHLHLKWELEHDLKLEPDPHFMPKQEPKFDVKLDTKVETDEEGAGTLAAAIIARAVLLCRASLYPGLHTIIAPAAPPAAPATDTASHCNTGSEGAGGGGAGEAECSWCLRQFASRRCLWYGPARETPVGARAWRRVRARRYLCACCGSVGGGGSGAEGGAQEPGGWYGKGYRKGRRRRR